MRHVLRRAAIAVFAFVGAPLALAQQTAPIVLQPPPPTLQQPRQAPLTPAPLGLPLDVNAPVAPPYSNFALRDYEGQVGTGQGAAIGNPPGDDE